MKNLQIPTPSQLVRGGAVESRVTITVTVREVDIMVTASASINVAIRKIGKKNRTNAVRPFRNAIMRVS